MRNRSCGQRFKATVSAQFAERQGIGAASIGEERDSVSNRQGLPVGTRCQNRSARAVGLGVEYDLVLRAGGIGRVQANPDGEGIVGLVGTGILVVAHGGFRACGKKGDPQTYGRSVGTGAVGDRAPALCVIGAGTRWCVGSTAREEQISATSGVVPINGIIRVGGRGCEGCWRVSIADGHVSPTSGWRQGRARLKEAKGVVGIGFV